MRIGILGFGRMGQALAYGLRRTSHEVRAGTRQPAMHQPPAWTAIASYHDVAAWADVIVTALPWPAVLTTARVIAPLLRKTAIVIDCSNPEAEEGPGLVADLPGSAAEQLALVIGRCRVVKAFNHIHAELLIAAPDLDTPPTVFYCGGNTAAKQTATAIIEALACEPVDVGPLQSARYLEPLSQVMVHLVRQQGLGPDRIALNLWRRS